MLATVNKHYKEAYKPVAFGPLGIQPSAASKGMPTWKAFKLCVLHCLGALVESLPITVKLLFRVSTCQARTT